MNDQLFGLPLAPFSAVPDVNVFVETPKACAAIHQLTRSLLRDDGIAVLTGEVGVGKTIIGKVLADRLSEKLRPLVLSSANFPTRRALYQSVLFSLGKDFVGLSEQEARLLVLESSKEQLADRGNLVLIIDEAHLLTDRLLDELRSLVSNADEGSLLVQVVLIGHSSLHERLQDPRFLDLRQRIGCFTHLDPLSPAETMDYIRERLFAAGSDVVDVIDTDALHLIADVSNGYPRCVNTLCDRAIGLAVESKADVVDHAFVRLALSELRQLPLTWNESNLVDASAVEDQAGEASTNVTEAESAEVIPMEPETIETAVDLAPDEEWASFEIGSDWSEANDADDANASTHPTGATTADGFEEIAVVDPYAQFDALLQGEHHQHAIKENVAHGVGGKSAPVKHLSVVHDECNADDEMVSTVETCDVDCAAEAVLEVAPQVVADSLADEPADSRWEEELVEESWDEISVLEAIHELRAEIRGRSHADEDRDESDLAFDEFSEESFAEESQLLETSRTHLMIERLPLDEVVEYDVVEPEQWVAEEPQTDPAVEAPPMEAAVPTPPPVAEPVATIEEIETATTESHEASPVEPATRFAGLFTRLRRKRRELAEGTTTQR